MNPISNEALKLSDLPSRDASWSQLERFALTFDGYAAFGNELGGLASAHRAAGTVPHDLSELRGILFLEQRSWRHVMSQPDEAGLGFIWALIEGIRAHLERR